MENAFQTIFFWVVFAAIGSLVITWMVALMRRPLCIRNETEIILDLIESADREGKAIEREFVELAKQNDPALGPHFYLFTSWLGQGRPLVEAIRKTPTLMTEPIRHMLIHGLENDSLKQVLPCCRQRLEEADNRCRTTMGVLTGSGCGANLLVLPVMLLIWIFILPKFDAIISDMAGARYSDLAPLFYYAKDGPLQVAFLFVYFLMFMNIWIFAGLAPARGMFPLLDAGLSHLASLRNRLPWLRLRLERDLSSLLAGFIDAGMPTETALAHAGQAVGDLRIQARAEAAGQRLSQGLQLDQALACVSPDRQFAWHLRNAGKSKSGFSESLRVWHDTLTARAAFKENAAAQISTASLIICSGVLVGYFCAAIFQFLSNLIDALV